MKLASISSLVLIAIPALSLPAPARRSLESRDVGTNPTPLTNIPSGSLPLYMQNPMGIGPAMPYKPSKAPGTLDQENCNDTSTPPPPPHAGPPPQSLQARQLGGPPGGSFSQQPPAPGAPFPPPPGPPPPLPPPPQGMNGPSGPPPPPPPAHQAMYESQPPSVQPPFPGTNDMSQPPPPQGQFQARDWNPAWGLGPHMPLPSDPQTNGDGEPLTPPGPPPPPPPPGPFKARGFPDPRVGVQLAPGEAPFFADNDTASFAPPPPPPGGQLGGMGPVGQPGQPPKPPYGGQPPQGPPPSSPPPNGPPPPPGPLGARQIPDGMSEIELTAFGPVIIEEAPAGGSPDNSGYMDSMTDASMSSQPDPSSADGGSSLGDAGSYLGGSTGSFMSGSSDGLGSGSGSGSGPGFGPGPISTLNSTAFNLDLGSNSNSTSTSTSSAWNSTTSSPPNGYPAADS